MLRLMVNWDRITELQEEVGEDDLAEVLQLFCEEVEEALSALSTTDAETLKGHLHFLKGSALNIGLDQVSTLCREAEQTLASNPQSNILVEAIRSAYQSARVELKDLF